jgi:hypothetical protein
MLAFALPAVSPVNEAATNIIKNISFAGFILPTTNQHFCFFVASTTLS